MKSLLDENIAHVGNNPIFLLDSSCAISRRDHSYPKWIVRDLIDLEIREAKDSVIKRYLDKEKLILITSDYRFALKMVLASKKIIFVENNFDSFSFHIVYPSIEVGKSIFWRHDIINILQENN